jgi:hypothetical protein
MLEIRVLNKNVMPFQLTDSFNDFQTFYIKAKKNQCAISKNKVYLNLSPTFSKWEELLQTRRYYSDINIYTLLRLLQADNKTPGTLENKIFLLEQYLDLFSITYMDIFLEAFLLHIKKKSYIPMYRYIKEKDLQYYIAKEIKMFIFSIIRKYINYQRKQNLIKSFVIPRASSYNDYYFDYNYLNTLPREVYRHYLSYFLTESSSNSNNLHNKETVCQLIKTLLSSN